MEPPGASRLESRSGRRRDREEPKTRRTTDLTVTSEPMHYVRKPRVIDVMEWEAVEADYTDSLILGNGSSIAISPAFSYKSLFETAREAAHLNPAVLGVFQYLKTRDFE